MLGLAAGLVVAVGGTTFALAADQTTGATGTTDDVVRTDKGIVKGVVDEQSRQFHAIPYAAPPVDDLRWQLPKPAEKWTGVRDATTPAPDCAQLNETGDALKPGSSEDCLYLNVTTPRAAAEPRPVMVWFHGGGWVSGTANDYDGRWLAKTGDVIVVTVNYRLGTLGFFGHPDLPDSGTYGLGDQQAALRWVRANAGAFGGDPHNVTIFGESAGALSTCAQLASPTAAGLFQRAIVESGSCEMGWPDNLNYPDGKGTEWWEPREKIAAAGEAEAANLNCPDLACLRKTDVLAVQQASAFTNGGYGTTLLPLNPRDALRYGTFNRVPVMQGNTRDEQAYFGWLFELGGPMDAAGYQQNLDKTFGAGNAAAIAAEYPVSEYRKPIDAWNAVTTDRGWICPTVRADRNIARHNVPVYSFSFADRTAPAYVSFPPGYESNAYHSSELPYLFDFGDKAPLNAEQAELSRSMLRYWTNFASTGDPNGPELPTWQRFHDGQTSQSFQLGGITTVDLDQQHHCGFWAGLPTE